jgi:hypothetical protein
MQGKPTQHPVEHSPIACTLPNIPFMYYTLKNETTALPELQFITSTRILSNTTNALHILKYTEQTLSRNDIEGSGRDDKIQGPIATRNSHNDDRKTLWGEDIEPERSNKMTELVL